MRQEPKNEIDLLLKRLGRGQSERVPDGSNHLDADELSSYAENALPPATRLRYTEHLAECAPCRELVVQLSAAAGVVVAEEPARVSAPAGLRKFFASLFSPMVLRYAVPAMGVLVVAVIGLIVFRQGGGDFMAKRSASERPVLTQEAQPQPSSSSEQDQTQVKPFATVETPAVRGNKAKQPAAGEETATAAAPVTATTDEPAKVAETPQVEKKQAASEPAPPPAAAKPSDTAAGAGRVEPQTQKDTEQARIAAKEVEQQPKLQDSQQAGKTELARSRVAKDKATMATPSFGSVANERGRRDSDDNYSDDAETRSVAGRRFRKQRGIWVDTAYSGATTVNLTRGSEQYRALVADEPEIKTIAQKLDGQIIVVWKSRAYRIR